jgi:hypothetical protein
MELRQPGLGGKATEALGKTHPVPPYSFRPDRPAGVLPSVTGTAPAAAAGTPPAVASFKACHHSTTPPAVASWPAPRYQPQRPAARGSFWAALGPAWPISQHLLTPRPPPLGPAAAVSTSSWPRRLRPSQTSRSAAVGVYTNPRPRARVARSRLAPRGPLFASPHAHPP